MSHAEVQTRSETTGLRMWPTLKDALEHAKKDHSVWKISFSLASGKRVRLVKLYPGGSWFYSILGLTYQEDGWSHE